MTIRVLVIDDHPLVRAGVRSELEKSDVIEVVGDAADVDSAVEACHSLQPDVALLDVHLPGGGGGGGPGPRPCIPKCVKNAIPEAE